MRTSVTLPAGTYIESTQYTLTDDLTGCPAGFALTAMQQVISFVCFSIIYILVYFTPYRYTPKTLSGAVDCLNVVIFGCVFALNIALNNFSLGYISIAVNLIIRSCLPLSTFLFEQILALFNLYKRKPCRAVEIVLMSIGVICAGVFTAARLMGTKAEEHSYGSTILGVLVCLAATFCGSMNLALAGVLGEQQKLNEIDTVIYMAVPAAFFLLPFAIFLRKPVPGEWSQVFGQPMMSDWEILRGTWSINKATMAWLALSGVFSLAYNIIQFSIVHTLSPSATAFGGNFNKATLIFLTLLLPVLRVHELPGSPYIQVIWAAVVINIASFSYYSFLQIQRKKEEENSCIIISVDRQDHYGKVGCASSGDESSGNEEDEGKTFLSCCREKRPKTLVEQGI